MCDIKFDKDMYLKLPKINILSCDDGFMKIMMNFNKVLSERILSANWNESFETFSNECLFIIVKVKLQKFSRTFYRICYFSSASNNSGAHRDY